MHKARALSFLKLFAVTILLAGLFIGKASASTYPEFLKIYDSLLNDYVSETTKDNVSIHGVDYIQWSEDERHNLALKLLLASDPDLFLSRDRRKAFWINAYNFLTIDLIVKENEFESIKNLGGFFATPWTKHKWEISGKPYTLDQIENEILRPLNDARIHFALSCATISCPDLRPEAYFADTLNTQLDNQVQNILTNHDKGMATYDHTLYLHKDFLTFAKDFNDGKILSWIEQYVRVEPHGEIVYFDENWQLNSQ